MLILWLLDWEGRHANAENRPLTRLFRWTGDISYSLYAVHVPVILFVTWAMTCSGRPGYLWHLATTLLLSLAVTVAMHYGIEKRFYRPRA